MFAKISNFVNRKFIAETQAHNLKVEIKSELQKAMFDHAQAVQEFTVAAGALLAFATIDRSNNVIVKRTQVFALEMNVKLTLARLQRAVAESI